jgi:hypothetical protein
MEDFEILIASSDLYKYVVVEIWLHDKLIAIVQKEEGIDNILIEFYADPNKTKVGLDKFIKALEKAKAELL